MKNHVVLLTDLTVAREEVLRIVGLLGLSLITSQEIGLLGKIVYQFQISSGLSLADLIRRLASYAIIDGAAPDNRARRTATPVNTCCSSFGFLKRSHTTAWLIPPLSG